MDDNYSECDTDSTEFQDSGTAATRTTKSSKESFVWKFYNIVQGEENIYECNICKNWVKDLHSNLARHLYTAHNIGRETVVNDTEVSENSARLRPSRSFIWKFCTKEDSKHARCHLCKKVLYYGGGNTSNIAKHLRRMHPEHCNKADDSSEEFLNVNGGNEELSNSERKDRKGGSYVWNFCQKISRTKIRCKLCNKVMSFHGTANVITHLQRKHNILGRQEKYGHREPNTADILDDSEEAVEQLTPNDDKPYFSNRRSSTSSSIVWKYCTRVSADTVLCSFCRKKLSFQGTSNLQRHLHRMHGIVTHARMSKDEFVAENIPTQLAENLILEFSSLHDDGTARCNLCDLFFETQARDKISTHLLTMHAIKPSMDEPPTKRSREWSDDDVSYEPDTNDDNWSNRDSTEEGATEQNAEDIKKNVSFDMDNIEEFIEEEKLASNYDEEEFDPKMLQDLPLANALSANTSRASSPVRSPSKAEPENKRLKELNEERLRMETEYFRQKAAYYRMQKFMVALQAKKLRFELERMNSQEVTLEQFTTAGQVTILPTNEDGTITQVILPS